MRVRTRPTVGIKSPTEDEQRELLDKVDNYKYGYMLRFQDLTGFRVQEICSMNVKHYNSLNQTYTLQTQKNGCDGEIVVLSNQADQLLKDWLRRMETRINANHGWIWFNGRGGHIKPSTIHNYYAHLREFYPDLFGQVYKISKNGRKFHTRTTHSNRHRFINRVGEKVVQLKGTYDETTVMALSRHKSRHSLDSYRIITEGMKRRIVDAVLND